MPNKLHIQTDTQLPHFTYFMVPTKPIFAQQVIEIYNLAVRQTVVKQPDELVHSFR